MQCAEKPAEFRRLPTQNRARLPMSAVSPLRQGTTLHDHGYPQPGRPIRTGTGTGSGRRGASCGSQRCSCSIRDAAAARRGRRTARSSPRRAQLVVPARADIDDRKSGEVRVLCLEKRSNQCRIDVNFCFRQSLDRHERSHAIIPQFDGMPVPTAES